MNFELITLTGADEHTSLDQLIKLVADNERLEVGLLYSASPGGRNRYPSSAWLASAAEALAGRCAIHVCGRQARNELLAGKLSSIVSHAARVQVNGAMSLDELQCLTPLAQELIVQFNDTNEHLIASKCLKLSFLVDASGGRGFSPSRWSRPCTERRVGFAGGLGPKNLETQLPLIAEVCGPHSWIDMETRLRVDDRFDLGLARECLLVFKNYFSPPSGSVVASQARKYFMRLDDPAGTYAFMKDALS